MARFIVHGIPGSPYVRTVLIALEEKQADYRLQAIAFGAQKGEEYRRLQPFARIPVIEDGDFRLYETHAILRYLDRVLPEPALVPADPRAAARMDQVIGITDCYVTRQVSAPISFQRLVASRFGLPVDESAVAAALPDADLAMSVLAGLLGEQDYLVGSRVTLADLMLIPHLSYLRQTPEGGEILARYPGLVAWIERMEARDSLQATTWEKVAGLAEAA
jgi:glutathione S-transferase